MGEVSAGSDTDSATTLVHDVGWDNDIGDTTPPGCQGKIDFLFVMSEHGTLKEAHPGLAAAFPKWVETIESKFESFDVLWEPWASTTYITYNQDGFVAPADNRNGATRKRSAPSSHGSLMRPSASIALASSA